MHDLTNELIRIRNLDTAIMRVIFHVGLLRHINKAIAFAGSAVIVKGITQQIRDFELVLA